MEFGKFRRGDRDERGNNDRPRFGGDGDRGRPQFGGDRGGDRGGNRYGDRGGSDRPRFDRGGGGGFDKNEEESVFSTKVRAGKRRTYFFDVRKTRGDDFFITITESTRREDGYGYKRHKIFLYKEDFNRFVASLNEVVNHVKTELMPEFDYEEFDRRQAEWEAQNKDENADDDDSKGRPDDDDISEKDRKSDNDAPKGKDDDDDVSW